MVVLPFLKAGQTGYNSEVRDPGLGCEADRTQSGKRFASKKAQIVVRALVPGTQGVSEPVIVLPTKKEAPRPPSPPETQHPRGCAGCRRHMWNRRRRPESAPSSAPAKNLGKRRHHKTSRPGCKALPPAAGPRAACCLRQDATPVSLHHQSRRGHRWPERPCPDVHRAI